MPIIPDRDASLTKLIKLLGMTTSANDGEALAAMRLANRELLKFNASWEELLRGKVTIVSDPFADIPAPPSAAPRQAPPDFHTPKAAPSVPKRPPPPKPPFVYPANPAHNDYVFNTDMGSDMWWHADQRGWYTAPSYPKNPYHGMGFTVPGTAQRKFWHADRQFWGDYQPSNSPRARRAAKQWKPTSIDDVL